MKQHPMRAGGVLVSLFGLLCLAAPALGQGDDDNDNNNKAKKVGVHKLEIYNGELRTVHYFTDGLSEEERADVRDLQQAQNDVAFAQYNKGLAVQPIGPGFVRPVGFFGYGFGFPGSFGYGLPGFAGYAGYPAAFAGDIVPAYFSNLNYVLSDSAPLYPGFLPYLGFGYAAYNAPYSYAGGRPIVGAAYLDRPKSDVPLSKTLREEVSQATRRLDMAMGRVMRNDALAKAFDLRKGKGSDLRFAGTELDKPYRVTVTMKKGPDITGRLVREDANTVTVKSGGEEIEIRKSETVTIKKRPLKGQE